MPERNRVIDWALRPRAGWLLLMAAVLLAADQALLHVSENSPFPGLLDETAHLLTGALVLAALRGLVDRQFAVGLLTISVLIDLDHLPGLLGVDWITHGTDRPYSHSLLTLTLIGLAAVVWRSRRSLLLGAILGLAVHFGRDMSESKSGVPFLWPWSYHSYTSEHWIYLVAMGAVVGVGLWRAWSGARYVAQAKTAESLRRLGEVEEA